LNECCDGGRGVGGGAAAVGYQSYPLQHVLQQLRCCNVVITMLSQ
jgi:hypothetical protein